MDMKTIEHITGLIIGKEYVFSVDITEHRAGEVGLEHNGKTIIKCGGCGSFSHKFIAEDVEARLIGLWNFEVAMQDIALREGDK